MLSHVAIHATEILYFSRGRSVSFCFLFVVAYLSCSVLPARRMNVDEYVISSRDCFITTNCTAGSSREYHQFEYCSEEEEEVFPTYCSRECLN